MHTEATNISKLFQCARVFGGIAKTSLIGGTVVEVLLGKTKTQGNKTGLRVRWAWLSKDVETVQGRRRVRTGPPPAPAPLQENQSPEGGSPVSQPSQQPPGEVLTATESSPPEVQPVVAGGRRAAPPSSPVPFSQTLPLPLATRAPHLRSTSSTTRAPSPPPLAATSATEPAASIKHGVQWTPRDVLQPVGGPVPRQAWSVPTASGQVIHEGGHTVRPGAFRTPCNYFTAMLPHDQLVRMVQLTSAKLRECGAQPTTAGDMLKFFGVIVLGTRYEFGSRDHLWTTKLRNMYLHAPALGELTGLPRSRFDALWSSLTFSQQIGDGSDTLEKARWELVNDFVSSINAHRAAHVTPSDLLCVEEFMSKWYGQGGHWIDRGLPMYVAIDRQPEKGCEIQNASYARSGIRPNLRLVTAAKYRCATHADEGDDLPHGTVILMELVCRWAGTMRIVCAGSYFSSVPAAKKLLAMGLRFIGVVKTATRGYPMGALSVFRWKSTASTHHSRMSQRTE